MEEVESSTVRLPLFRLKAACPRGLHKPGPVSYHGCYHGPDRGTPHFLASSLNDRSRCDRRATPLHDRPWQLFRGALRVSNEHRRSHIRPLPSLPEGGRFMTIFPARPPRLKKSIDEHGGVDSEELRQLARQRCAEGKSLQRSARQTSLSWEGPSPYSPCASPS